MRSRRFIVDHRDAFRWHADHARRFNEATAFNRGSRWRRRLIAPEDVGASMRPRRFTVDYEFCDDVCCNAEHASMRPQRFTVDYAPGKSSVKSVISLTICERSRESTFRLNVIHRGNAFNRRKFLIVKEQFPASAPRQLMHHSRARSYQEAELVQYLCIRQDELSVAEADESFRVSNASSRGRTERGSAASIRRVFTGADDHGLDESDSSFRW